MHAMACEWTNSWEKVAFSEGPGLDDEPPCAWAKLLADGELKARTEYAISNHKFMDENEQPMEVVAVRGDRLLT